MKKPFTIFLCLYSLISMGQVDTLNEFLMTPLIIADFQLEESKSDNNENQKTTRYYSCSVRHQPSSKDVSYESEKSMVIAIYDALNPKLESCLESEIGSLSANSIKWTFQFVNANLLVIDFPILYPNENCVEELRKELIKTHYGPKRVKVKIKNL